MQMYSESDVDVSCLSDKKIAVLGYGSQGRAHALNLKDSGFNVVVGLRKSGASWPIAEADGLDVEEPNEAVKGAAIVMFLTPDMVQKALYQSVVDDIENGAMLLFAHGFAIHYGQVEPRADLDVALIAPKGPGGLVRRQYEEGHGVPCLVAVHQDSTTHCKRRSPILPVLAAPAPALSRQRSPKKPRPICLASRRYCAAAQPN